MPIIEIISLVLGVLVTTSVCLWVGLGFRLWIMNKSKPVIREGLSLPNPEGEEVSVIVPVHNEERVIGRCATSLRNQTHKKMQIIFVLDRCVDRTKEILQKHAEEDERICIIENDSCPDDWAGKCNAARRGVERATGDWLLFTDADTEFDCELVRCSVASAIKREASLLSLLSSLTIDKNFERVVQPIASTFLVRQFPVDRINREHRPRPFANGQFLLFTREAYDEIGGHDAVKEHLLEDFAFARCISFNGAGKVQVLFADGMLKCSMYPTFTAFQSGWKRIYIEAATRSVKRLKQSAILAIVAGIILPLAGIAGVLVGQHTSPTLFWMSVTSLITAALVIGWLYRINNAPVMYGVFAPLGAVVVAKMFIESVRMLKNRTPICWGGKEYILEPRK